MTWKSAVMCPWICPPPLVLSHGTFLRGLSGLCHSCADHSSLLSVVGPSQLHFCGLHVSRPISLREIPRSGLGVGVPSYLGKLMLQGGAPHLPSRGLGQRSVACRNAWGLPVLSKASTCMFSLSTCLSARGTLVPHCNFPSL